MKTKIIHLTSAHQRIDVRIFVKMCCSLAKLEQYEVSLVVADGKGDEKLNNVSIYDTGTKSNKRFSRMTRTVKKIFRKAKELDGEIYHLHDPELIPIGLKLKKLGKKVIFDAHEDLPKQILSKPYLQKFLLKLISNFILYYEKYTCKKFDYIITATTYIKDKFLLINKNSISIKNFPILDEFSEQAPSFEKNNEVCYIGGISRVRGVKEVVQSMEFVQGVKLNIAGLFQEKDIELEIKNLSSWSKVNELGFLNREKITELLAYSKAGLVTLHPIINYVDALPVKLFEYMAAGIPVICSNIKLWREIVNTENCGICVNPLVPEEIARAIEYITTHPKEAEQMGVNGKNAVKKKYNWSIEEKKLFKVYEVLINEK